MEADQKLGCGKVTICANCWLFSIKSLDGFRMRRCHGL